MNLKTTIKDHFNDTVYPGIKEFRLRDLDKAEELAIVSYRDGAYSLWLLETPEAVKQLREYLEIEDQEQNIVLTILPLFPRELFCEEYEYFRFPSLREILTETWEWICFGFARIKR